MRHQIRWTLEKIENRLSNLKEREYYDRRILPPFRYHYLTSPDEAGKTQIGVDDSKWPVIQYHEYWANPRTDFVLRTHFELPKEWLREDVYNKDKFNIALYLPIGDSRDFSHPEALVYIDGKPVAACDRHHQEVILSERYLDNQEHILALHGWTGIGGASIRELTDRLKMNPCEIVLIDQVTRDFLALARVSHGIARQLSDNDPAKSHLLTALDDAFKEIDLRQQTGSNIYHSIPAALRRLNNDVEKAGPPLDVEISAIGHAHLDIAWLWTLDQSRQKAGRTFHNVLRLMDHFPNFYFVQSQPQLYDFVRQDFPELFEKIKEKVKEGRWEPTGGMWVEADCNITGSEALVRQFLLGRLFYREHFGLNAESPILWLPDVFGYAWNLPQLIKEAGLKYFFTIKIGWSQYNRLPYDSFWWQGLDGSKVLTHFSTTKDPDSPFAATYNSDASPAEIIGTWKNFQQKDYGPPGKVLPILMSYGYGDGGGGPTREMIENVTLLGKFPSTPKIKLEKANHFFQRMESRSHTLPIWNGELYLEYHRGTYTTQARNKKTNRKSEFLLHDAEFLATYATLIDKNYRYPYKDLQKAWKFVCLNQFHDIIPGSSIGPVYSESLDQYKEVQDIAGQVIMESQKVISETIGYDHFVVNPSSFPRHEHVIIDDEEYPIRYIEPYSIHIISDDMEKKSIDMVTNDLVSKLSCSKSHLENKFLRVEFNSNGDIIRIFDKENGREVLPDNGIANQFLAFEDIPLSWDAWDIDIFFEDKVWFAEPAKEIKVNRKGVFKKSLIISRKILKSDYTQIISMDYNKPRLDIKTMINWQERQTLLKVAFPVNVLSPTATYEIQWGNVERPTHRNTSWDWARFETAAHKWVDLSEGGYGVSLLNDCKYGHDIHENIIRLTLLRGTTAPDPMADLGEHSFTYSLFPHQGSWGIETVREAYCLNDPLIVFHSSKEKQVWQDSIPSKSNNRNSLPSLIKSDRDNIIIETIKKAEDGNGIIIRLYEYQRKRGNVTLITAFPIHKVWRTNILEENQEEIKFNPREISIPYRPYQIITLRIVNDGEIDL